MNDIQETKDLKFESANFSMDIPRPSQDTTDTIWKGVAIAAVTLIGVFVGSKLTDKNSSDS
ncbi:MAG: hypothetical protein U9Q30_04460 [Campylobacterota bacterium]|nr:hypothetical protein [Campylobacterota bacterium]